ncbi:hypothetical protein LCGC14_1290880 [marine sediment metagenome]|uniref:Uncharacterized protein n=1 Tax=marine sediment metagenome TaxID=412755 RepID=A0A0F9N8Z6_9ZZZZ
MAFIARHTASRIGAGVGGAARINQAEEIVGIPWLYQLALQGDIYLAGTGIAEAGIDDDDGVLDEEGLLVLQAPSSGKLIIPLYMRAYFDTEQAQIPTIMISYIQASKTWGATTGTATTGINALGGASPNTQSALVWTAAVTDAAVSDAENVVLTERTNMLVSFITNEMATGDVAIETPGVSSTEFTWIPDFPIILAVGSSILFQAFTPTARSKYNVTVAWAELDSSVYGL